MVVWSLVHMMNPTVSGKKRKWMGICDTSLLLYKSYIDFPHWNRWKNTTWTGKNAACARSQASRDIQSLSVWTMAVKCFWLEKKVFNADSLAFFPTSKPNQAQRQQTNGFLFVSQKNTIAVVRFIGLSLVWFWTPYFLHTLLLPFQWSSVVSIISLYQLELQLLLRQSSASLSLFVMRIWTGKIDKTHTM